MKAVWILTVLLACVALAVLMPHKDRYAMAPAPKLPKFDRPVYEVQLRKGNKVVWTASVKVPWESSIGDTGETLGSAIKDLALTVAVALAQSTNAPPRDALSTLIAYEDVLRFRQQLKVLSKQTRADLAALKQRVRASGYNVQARVAYTDAATHTFKLRGVGDFYTEVVVDIRSTETATSILQKMRGIAKKYASSPPQLPADLLDVCTLNAYSRYFDKRKEVITPKMHEILQTLDRNYSWMALLQQGPSYVNRSTAT